MVTKLRNIVLLIGFFILESCFGIWFFSEPIRLERKSYLGNNLRIDGYYHATTDSEEELGDSFFLYQNGIVISPYFFKESEKEKFEEGWVLGTSIETTKIYRSSYGAFTIEKDTIKMESWGDYGGTLGKTYVVEGTIVNDTTIYLHSYYNFNKKMKKKEYRTFSYTYHFHQFSPKPDSTNNYVE